MRRQADGHVGVVPGFAVDEEPVPVLLEESALDGACRAGGVVLYVLKQQGKGKLILAYYYVIRLSVILITTREKNETIDNNALLVLYA